jgi:hypothetical protein
MKFRIISGFPTVIILVVLSIGNLQAQADNSSWKQYTDSTNEVTFRYPESLGTKYINTQAWPPNIQITNVPFTCIETKPDEYEKTAERIINGRTYCVTEVSEGAAGHIYTQYTYAFSKNDMMVTLSFTLTFVQCGNFDDPAKHECEEERHKFDIGSIIDQIAQTISINK